MNQIWKDNPQTARAVSSGTKTALALVGKIAKGDRMIGLTKGQFSLIDLLKATLESTGPADVVISTWTTGIRDAEEAAWLLNSGRIRSIRFLTDRSFPTRQPKYAAEMLRKFGRESIVCTRTHAKFLIVCGDDLEVCVRSSMNLNKNPRFEQFDLDESPAICAWLQSHVDELVRDKTSGFAIDEAEVWAAFQESLGGGYAGESPSLDASDGFAKSNQWWRE